MIHFELSIGDAIIANFVFAILYSILIKWLESKRIRTKNRWTAFNKNLPPVYRMPEYIIKELRTDEVRVHGITFSIALIVALVAAYATQAHWFWFLHAMASFAAVYMVMDIPLNKLMGWKWNHLSDTWLFDKLFSFHIRIGLLAACILIAIFS